MICLAIHSAGPSCGVAILKGDECLAEMTEPMRRGHDQRLPILAGQVCQAAGLRFQDIDTFAVCVGPGSFTGIRVGVAFARGLALANAGMAVGVTSLEALLATPGGTDTLALIPARQRPPDQSFWAQSFTPGGIPGEPEELDASLLASRYHEALHIVTTPDGEEMVRGFLPDAVILTKNFSASDVGRWAVYRPQTTRRAPSPLYVRAPDAIPARPALSKA